MNTTWTVRIERMELSLPVGIHVDELEPQTVWVSLAASGSASAEPRTLEQCFDYAPVCRWLTETWPGTPHTALLETRINQLLDFIFGVDVRFETVWAGLYKQRMSRQAMAVGIERSMTRAEFEARSADRASLAIRSSADASIHESKSNAPIPS